MQENIINRLFSSFDELEKAIESAKVTLNKRTSIPEDVLQRIGSYDEILRKQRTLAKTLCTSINQGDWSEVSRVVNLINGLSTLIRDDAKAILSSLSLNSDIEPSEHADIPMC